MIKFKLWVFTGVDKTSIRRIVLNTKSSSPISSNLSTLHPPEVSSPSLELPESRFRISTKMNLRFSLVSMRKGSLKTDPMTKIDHNMLLNDTIHKAPTTRKMRRSVQPDGVDIWLKPVAPYLRSANTAPFTSHSTRSAWPCAQPSQLFLFQLVWSPCLPSCTYSNTNSWWMIGPPSQS